MDLNYDRLVNVVVQLEPNLQTLTGVNKNAVIDVIDSQNLRVLESESNTSILSDRCSSDSNLYTFDRIFNLEYSPYGIRDYILKDSLVSMFQGGNTMILAYGQTESNDSYRIFGDKKSGSIIENICRGIFDNIKLSNSDEHIFTVSVTFIEVYLDKIHDILNDNTSISLPLQQSDNVKLKSSDSDVNVIYVNNEAELLDLLNSEQSQRNNEINNIESENLRPHLLIQISLNKTNKLSNNFQKSNLFLVDFSSSMHVSKTNSMGIDLKDEKTNYSLNSLGNIIHYLLYPSNQVPRISHEDSEINWLLSGCLGKDGKSTVILNCSNSNDDITTLCTLNFGAKARSIKSNSTFCYNNIPTKNKLTEDIDVFKKKDLDYQKRICLLEEELNDLRAGISNNNTITTHDIITENKKLKSQVDSTIKLLDQSSKNNTETDISIDELTKALLNKCDEVVEIQSELDTQIQTNLKLKKELHMLKSRDKELNGMNHELLIKLEKEQLASLNLTNEVRNLHKDLTTTHKISDTRASKIKVLESSIKELSGEKIDTDTWLNSIDSRTHNESTLIDSDTHTSTLWGLFGSRRSSTSSSSTVITKTHVCSTRPKKGGLNLNVVRPIFGATPTK